MESADIKTICMCGGGALTHTIAASLAHRGVTVNVLTRNPGRWGRELTAVTPQGSFTAPLGRVSDRPGEVVPEADVVLLTVPGYANAEELARIAPWLKPGAMVGGVFCSSGFFFEAMKVLPAGVRLWGFQRVPYISRVGQYGHTANLLGYRPELKMATERMSAEESEALRRWVEDKFGTPATLLKNYLEASITNSNPILHTARLYAMFGDWDEGKRGERNILFYEEWTDAASQLLIDMDRELFSLLERLPVTGGYLVPLLEYYESHDAASLTAKISSIGGFKGILSPMKEVDGGWVPDYGSRYFTEDFGYSLKYIRDLAREYGVEAPNIEKVYEWGRSKLKGNV